MAAPNIVGITTLVGITTFLVNAGTASTTFLSNPADSNRVFRIITLVASNKAAGAVNVSVSYTSQEAGAGTSVSIVRNASVPAGSSLIVIGRDAPYYLEENRSIIVSAGVTTSIDFISTYESIGSN